MSAGVRATIGGSFAGRSVSTAIVSARVGAAVGDPFTRGSIGSAIVSLGVGSAVSGALARGSVAARDVIVTDAHANLLDLLASNGASSIVRLSPARWEPGCS
jgi:hypothetical protein